jgi:hypothetical protein
MSTPRSTRAARATVAAALAAALTVGATAPALAAPKGPKGGPKGPVATAPVKGGQSAAAVRLVAKLAAVVDARLAKVAKHAAALPADQAEVVALNVGLDRALLAETVAAATVTDVRSAVALVKAYRPENYLQAVAALREAGELVARAEAVLAADALAVLDEAVAAALLVTATSPKADLQALHALLEEAAALVEAAEAAADEPVVEEPVVEEPVVTQPTPEQPVV